MAADDDETNNDDALLLEQWNKYKPNHTFNLVLNKESSNLFGKGFQKFGSPLPFVDGHALFTESRELAKLLRSHIDTILPNEAMIPCWEIVFEKVISEDVVNTFSTEVTARLRQAALRLARTPATIFGDPFVTMNGDAFVMKLNPFGASEPSLGIRTQRHDMVLWLASYNVLGNAWSLYSTQPLVEAPDPSRRVMKVTSGNQTFFVTQKAKDSMMEALESNSNKPTMFFRAKDTIRAVADTLEVDMLEYSMPQTSEQLQAFNWDLVTPGEWGTYPQGIDPIQDDFDKVRAVHQASKADKDAKARSQGQASSNVQSYCTYCQRWRLWRNMMAVFRAMNQQPNYPC
ncbi:hypothetical protein SEMRO_1373_G267280.1 [Seminavis robusta]|uniref:Uncharacterized protein n=1 Tax=Seminavis robusta TaxID=568900 RepID=A0A9N8HSE0_9STRA|nr:hypothetical protein SEMRO_1373_G267280.1 [Seminavis robusta]|eukprot:Sro1373_g267280.1 n/a (344) ;mRNA; f:28760-29791